MDKLLYIGGQWTGAELPKIAVMNPATGKQVGSVPRGGQKETAFAIDAAYEAFQTWSERTAYERAAFLEKYHDLLLEQADRIAQVLTNEMGKPLDEAKGEVLYSASFLKWYAEEGKRVYGRSIPSHVQGKVMQVIKQPAGVVGIITPWNFPAAMITRKLGPALAAGCTTIIKPPKQTPLTAILLVELAEQVGIPKGVVNLVTGSAAEIGDELFDNPKVRKVTFTGSTEIGKELIKKSANHVKKLSLELGGHAPTIVLDDANLDLTIQHVIASKFRNGGQTCICLNRIYVQEGIYDQFIDKFVVAASELKVGNGMDEGVRIGPVIDRAAYEKIDEHVKDAMNKGARCVLGGKGEGNQGGYFYWPTILADASPEMLIMNEETFGPVAPIQKVSDEDEAIRLANDTPFGLAAYIFTENYRRANKIIRALEYGIIGWNDGVPSAAQAPFGGMKESGLGREGGHEGMEEFLETKYVAYTV